MAHYNNKVDVAPAYVVCVLQAYDILHFTLSKSSLTPSV